MRARRGARCDAASYDRGHTGRERIVSVRSVEVALGQESQTKWLYARCARVVDFFESDPPGNGVALMGRVLRSDWSKNDFCLFKIAPSCFKNEIGPNVITKRLALAS